MTTYRLYLRSRVRRECLSAEELRAEMQAVLAGERESSCPTMIYEDRKYSYAIRGCQEFEAQDDIAALTVASLIYEACSDICDLYELWEGTRHIDQSKFHCLPSASAIRAKAQAAAVEAEEALLNSGSIIAQSRRLLARLSELRGDFPGPARFA
ncbi:MAG TPA: hypothetical protein VGL83_16785 [Stellaceae bacterium]|jgi:hypothetical protein